METFEVILNEIYENHNKTYFYSTELSSIFKKMEEKIIEGLKLFISLNFNESVETLFSKLSEQDKFFLKKNKVIHFFKVKTFNCLINETIDDEEEYDKKILEFLAKVKLGDAGKGVPTKQILAAIGGNATSLRNRLMSLEQKELVAGLGKTKSKTWVLALYKREAQRKINAELGILR